jgi:CheY-like chemotaxis protein
MEAVQSLLALSFDGLILDLETPGLESLFVISIARRIDPKLPVVAISTRPVGPIRELQLKGVVCCLVSPESTLELAQMIPLRMGEDTGGTAQREDALITSQT